VIVTNLTDSTVALLETERAVRGSTPAELADQQMINIKLAPYADLIVDDAQWDVNLRIQAAVNYLLYVGTVTIDQPPNGWVVDADGTLTPISDPGGGVSIVYTHTQGVPSAVWTVHHNLGMHPNITTVDTLQRVLEGDVTYQDLYTIVVTFSAPVSGYGYLS
jgi:hypothetical protein